MRPHFFLWSFVVGFLLGGSILFGPWFNDRGLFLLVLSGIGGLVVLWVPRYLNYLLVVIFGVGLAFLIGGRSHALWQGEKQGQTTFAHEVMRVQGFPVEKSLFREIVLKPTCTERHCERAVLWRAPLVTHLHAGEKIRFSCTTEEAKNFTPDFDYRLYLAKEGIGSICQKNGQLEERLLPDWQGRFFFWIEQNRQRTEKVLSRALPQPELGLALGLILGGGNFLDKDIEESFKRIGMTHIVAVSGYNILLVAAGSFFVLGALGLWRRQKLLLGSIIIWVFILFVGAPASAVRAGSMALLFFLALLTGRKASGFFVLILSAFLMLLFNPLLLFYDIGFQLSFLALLGILFSSEWLITKDWDKKEIARQTFMTTLWVEMYVLPLIVYYFGTLTWFSVVANMVLLPIIPLATLGSFALLLLGFLPDSLFLFLAIPVYLLLHIVILFAEFCARLPWVSLEGLKLTLEQLALVYSIIILFSVVQLRKRRKNWYAKAFVVDD